MKPRTAPRALAEDLFRQRLENLLDTRHARWRLAEQIPWASCSEQLGSVYAERGRPGLPLRLLVGLQLWKHLHAVSEEEVVAQADTAAVADPDTLLVAVLALGEGLGEGEEGLGPGSGGGAGGGDGGGIGTGLGSGTGPGVGGGGGLGRDPGSGGALA